jgi:hypothetical protein
MGSSYFGSAIAREERIAREQQQRLDAEAQLSKARTALAAKIVMAVVDRIILEIVRPGPKPEERECYEMAGEMRAAIPELEKLAKDIIDVEDGVG